MSNAGCSRACCRRWCRRFLTLRGSACQVVRVASDQAQVPIADRASDRRWIGEVVLVRGEEGGGLTEALGRPCTSPFSTTAETVRAGLLRHIVGRSDNRDAHSARILAGTRVADGIPVAFPYRVKKASWTPLPSSLPPRQRLAST